MNRKQHLERVAKCLFAAGTLIYCLAQEEADSRPAMPTAAAGSSNRAGPTPVPATGGRPTGASPAAPKPAGASPATPKPAGASSVAPKSAGASPAPPSTFNGTLHFQNLTRGIVRVDREPDIPGSETVKEPSEPGRLNKSMQTILVDPALFPNPYIEKGETDNDYRLYLPHSPDVQIKMLPHDPQRSTDPYIEKGPAANEYLLYL